MLRRPHLIVGVAGASCTGKSRLVAELSALIGEDSACHLDLDGYHLHDRRERRELREYPEDRRSNDLDRAVHDIEVLRSGRPVDVPTYDHSSGTHGETKRLYPRPIVFVEGLHALLLNEGRSKPLVDFGVFMKPDEDLRRGWKTQRDVLERGYTYDELVEEIRQRQPYVKKQVLPQIDEADAIAIILLQRSAVRKRRLLASLNLVHELQGSDFLRAQLSRHLRLQQVKFSGRDYSEVRLVHLAELMRALKGKLPESIDINVPTTERTETRAHFGLSYTRLVQGLAALLVLRLSLGETECRRST